MGSDNPRRSLEMDGGLRDEDRRQRAGHRPQRQPEQRHDVSRSSRPSAKRSTRDYVEQRAKWERLYEATQTKGDGEAHPVPLAQRRVRRLRDLGQGQPRRQRGRRPRTCSQFEYARSALKNGLKLEAKLGTNPYKFGLIGSSDAHTGLAAMEEENFFGKTTPQEPSPERMLATFMDNPKTGIKIMDWEVGASGYAAVWAAGEHPRVDLGRHAAQGNLRHHRLAHDRALLRRLGLRARPMPRPATRAMPATPRACRWAAT